MASNSIIAIKGNVLNLQSEFMNTFRYVDESRDKEFPSYDAAMKYLFNNYFELAQKDVVLRGIWTDGAWAIICDPEMVDSTSEELLEVISQKLNSDILIFLIQSNSGSVGLAKYGPEKKRHFFKADGHIEENFGSPLPEENELKLETSLYDDITELTGKFGIDVEGKNSKIRFIIKELSFTQDLKKELEMYKQPQKALDKPWWKIW